MSPARTLVVQSLDDPALYEAVIEQLFERRQRERWCAPSDEISGALDEHPQVIAARLAREVPTHGHEFAPLLPHSAILQGKPRIIYRVDALDAVVWSAYARVLSQVIEPHLGNHLYSYRPGRSQFTAAADCVAFFKAHVASRPDPRARGLYIVHRDVRRYDEHIAVTEDSSLWTTLRELTRGWAFADTDAGARLMRAAFRPRIVQPEGSIAPNPRGMPTGIPTQNVACNVYLLPLDREMLAIEGGYYARFGDDILFAHASLEQARSAGQVIDDGVRRLGLTLNETKSRNFWLTGVGRTNPDAPDFVPVRKMPYLGLDIGFDGLRLRTDKRRQFLRDLFTRIDHAHAQVAGQGFDARASTVTSVVRAASASSHPLSHHYTSWLRIASMTRSDLAQLDHLIALHCAQRVTGKRGIRAFRLLSRRRLHEQFDLPSFVRLWDDARRAGRGKP